jgi:hypothetical protein
LNPLVYVSGCWGTYVATQMAVVECIGRTLPPTLVGVAIQLLSMDDAMVPLSHQEWVEIEPCWRP